MVMPRAFSSGALSIESNDRYFTFGLFFASTFVMQAVNVVLPWSICPIVPTFTCGFVLSYFSFAISSLLRPSPARLRRAALSRGERGPLPLGEAAAKRRVRVSLNGLLYFPALCSGYDFVRNLLRHFSIIREVHRIGSASLRSEPQVRCISEHR